MHRPVPAMKLTRPPTPYIDGGRPMVRIAYLIFDHKCFTTEIYTIPVKTRSSGNYKLRIKERRAMDFDFKIVARQLRCDYRQWYHKPHYN